MDTPEEGTMPDTQTPDADNSLLRETMWAELSQSETVMSDIRSRYRTIYQYYRLKRDEQDNPYHEDVMLPVIRSEIPIRVSRLVNGPLRSQRPVTVDPADDQTPVESAEALEDLIGEFWTDPKALNGVENAIKITKMADMAGVGWLVVGWKMDRRMVKGAGEIDPMTGQPAPAHEVEFDAPTLHVVHPYDAWPDPRFDTEAEMRYFYVREEVSAEELRQRAETGGYDADFVEQTIAQSPTNAFGGVAGLPVGGEERFNLLTAAGLVAPTPELETNSGGTATVYIFHRLTKDSWHTLSPNGDVLWFEDQPFPDGELPVLGLRPDPDMQGPMGVPMAEGSAGMQKLMNRTASQMQEFTAKVIDPIYGVRMTSPLARTQVKNIAGEFWPVMGPDDVFPVNKVPPGQFPTGMDWLQFQKYYADVGGATSDFQRSLASGGVPDTAFGIGKFTQQADERFGLTFTLVMNFWNRVFRKVGDYCQTLLQKEQWVKRIGRDGVRGPVRQVTPDMLQGTFRFNMEAATARLNPDTYFQAISSFVQVFGPTGAIGPGMAYLAREAADAIGIRDPQKASPFYVADPMPMEDEGMLLDLGVEIHPNPQDNHMEHLDYHLTRVHTGESHNPENEMAHIQETMAAMQISNSFGMSPMAQKQRAPDTKNGSKPVRDAREAQAEGGKGQSPGLAAGPITAPGRTPMGVGGMG